MVGEMMGRLALQGKHLSGFAKTLGITVGPRA